MNKKNNQKLNRRATAEEILDSAASKLLQVGADLHGVAMGIRSGLPATTNREFHRVTANARSGAKLLNGVLEILEELESVIMDNADGPH